MIPNPIDQLLKNGGEEEILKNYEEIFEILIKSGTDCSIQDSSNRNVVHILCEKGFGTLLKKVKLNEKILSSFNKNGCTPLILSIQKMNYSIFEYLIDLPCINLELADTSGQTPLTHAILAHQKPSKDVPFRDTEVEEFCWEKELNNFAGKYKISYPSHIFYPSENRISKLRTPPFIDPISETSNFSTMCNIITDLIDRGASVNEQSSNNTPIFTLVLMFGLKRLSSTSSKLFVEIVAKFFSAGVDPNERNRDGECGIHLIFDQLQQIISEGNYRTNDIAYLSGFSPSPLFFDVFSNFFKNWNSPYQFDPSLNDPFDNNCFHLAAKLHPSVLSFLLQKCSSSVDLESTNKFGESVIFYFITNSSQDLDPSFYFILRELLTVHRVNLNIQNINGVTRNFFYFLFFIFYFLFFIFYFLFYLLFFIFYFIYYL